MDLHESWDTISVQHEESLFKTCRYLWPANRGSMILLTSLLFEWFPWNRDIWSVKYEQQFYLTLGHDDLACMVQWFCSMLQYHMDFHETWNILSNSTQRYFGSGIVVHCDWFSLYMYVSFYLIDFSESWDIS